MTRPAPLTPPDCDLRAFRDMPFDIGRFRDSQLVTHEDPEAIVAAILLWGVAWHQVPAASLPDDDRLLAKYAGYGRALDSWLAVRDGALRGFVKCQDGRLYHRTLAEKANAAWDSRLRRQWQLAADRHRKAQAKLPETDRFDFPGFDDWKAGRTSPVPHVAKPENLELDLDLSSGFSTGMAVSERARTERAPAPRARIRTERARTGANPVPTDNSTGTGETFQRNAHENPPENALKGREGKGIEERKKDSHPDSSAETRAGRLANADLKSLYDAVCDASGFTSSSPEAINRAFQTIERWRDNGFDFDKTVIPTIKAVVAESSEPTRTLGRFTKAIAHEHARAKARGELGKPPSPPKVPILEPPGEDPVFLPIRQTLLETLGANVYAMAANEIRFHDVGRCGDKHPLRIGGPDYAKERWTSGTYAPYLRTAAKAHGFTDIWKE